MWIKKVTSAAEEAKKSGIAQAQAAASDPSLLAKGMAAASSAQAQLNDMGKKEEEPQEDAPAPVPAEE